MFSDLLRLFLDSSIDKNIGPPKVALVVKNPPANAGDLRAAGLIPGLGRSPGGGHGNPLQYSSGESHGQSSLGATVHGVSKSQHD